VIGSLISFKKNNFEISTIDIRDPFGPLRALPIFVVLKSLNVGGSLISCKRKSFEILVISYQGPLSTLKGPTEILYIEECTCWRGT